jgi:hypothetical protein
MAAQAPWGLLSDSDGPPTWVAVSDQMGIADSATVAHRPRTQRGPLPAIA